MRSRFLERKECAHHLTVYDVCIDGLPFKIDKHCNVFMVKGSRAEKLPLSPRSTLIYNGDEYQTRYMYLYTFYGYANIKVRFDKHGLPYYALDTAIFYRTPRGIAINFDEYRQIPGMEDYYISRHGVIYSQKAGKLCRHRIDKDGYHKVNISIPYGDNGNHAISIFAVHRLVYLAWVGPITEKNVVHHKDEVVWHNYPENLDDVSCAENVRLSAKRMTDEMVHEICQMMTKRIRIRDIAARFGYFVDKDPKAYYRFVYLCKAFLFPKSLKHWNDIVEQYDLQGYKIDSEDTIPYMQYLRKYADRTYRVLSDDEVAAILKGVQEGKTYREISNELKMSITTVSRYGNKFRKDNAQK